MKQLRHIAVGILALALSVGTGWQSCATLQQHTPVVFAAMDEMVSHHAMGHHDHMASAEHGGSQAIPSNESQSSDDSHACLKCCGACMLGGVAQTSPEWRIARVVSRVLLPSPEAQLHGHIVFVDPDIPKSVA